MDNLVEKEVRTIAKALAPMGGTKAHSDATIALGRLSAWAEAAMIGRSIIEVKGKPDE